MTTSISSFMSSKSSALSLKLEQIRSERHSLLEENLEKLKLPQSPLWSRQTTEAYHQQMSSPPKMDASSETQPVEPEEPEKPADPPSGLSPEQRLELVRQSLRALSSMHLEESPLRYPSATEKCCDHEEVAETRAKVIGSLHDRVRILEHALHLPPSLPGSPPYHRAMRPFSPLPLPQDKDVAIRRLMSDNRLLRDAVTTLQRAVREYEVHIAQLLSSGLPRPSAQPSAADSPLLLSAAAGRMSPALRSSGGSRTSSPALGARVSSPYLSATSPAVLSRRASASPSPLPSSLY